MPYHVLLDQAGEARLGKLQIGTTRRGIGPCYADKAARLGIRVQDLLDEKILRKKINAALEPKRQTLRPFAKDPQLDLHAMTEEYVHLRPPARAATSPTPRRSPGATLDGGRLVVFEGAQGTMLDIDHGTYPFVTSSNPVAGAACVGAGVGPTRDRRGLGHRQGLRHARRRRPVPHRARRRARRAASARPAASSAPPPAARGARGWLDLVALRYAARVNGLTGLVITKLDVLTGHRPAARGCPLPRARGRHLRGVPLPPVDPAQRAATYVELPGWDEDITGCRSIDELPRNAQDYLEFIERLPRRPDRDGRRGPGPRRDDLDRRRRARAPRRRLSPGRSGPHDVRRHDHVVQRAVLVVPQRPEPVEQRRDEEEARRSSRTGTT